MKKSLLKKIGTIALATVLSVVMIAPATVADKAYAADKTSQGNFVMTDEVYEQIDGKNVKDLEKNPELKGLLEDPTFLRYFEINGKGKITRKKVETSETDKFIAEMDKNAEGINNKEMVAMNSDMNAVGCGVSGLGLAQVPSKYASYGKSHCVDISYWQGKVSDANWQKIKAAGVTHAIIRVGYSALKTGEHNIDSVFSNNIIGANKAGIKVGVYYYSTATTAAEAQAEAKYTVTLLEKYRNMITLPVAFDYETGGRLTSSVMKKTGTATCTAFCDYISSAGYTPMVYANYVTLTNYVDYKTLQSKYRIWLANYTTNGTATTYPGEYWMWQYSSSGKVSGLSGNIDINYIFENGQSALATASLAAASTAPMSVKGSRAVTTCKMNYRTGPSTSKKKVGSYKKGTAVYFVSTAGDWAKLSNGYYMNRSGLKYIAKTTSGVNYRTGPGTNYTKKGRYSKGKLITIVKVKNGWAKMTNGYWLNVKRTKKQ